MNRSLRSLLLAAAVLFSALTFACATKGGSLPESAPAEQAASEPTSEPAAAGDPAVQTPESAPARSASLEAMSAALDHSEAAMRTENEKKEAADAEARTRAEEDARRRAEADEIARREEAQKAEARRIAEEEAAARARAEEETRKAAEAARIAAEAKTAVSQPTTVILETTKGTIVVEVHPEWAPLAAERFIELVEAHYYDGCKFFRVISGFMAQCGMNGDPKKTAEWKSKTIDDDARHPDASNVRGMLSFASAGKKSRTTQFFINFGDNRRLDDFGGVGFPPFAKVVEGLEILDKLYSGYGEGAPSGRGPSQARIATEGDAYLSKSFPLLDAITKAYVKR